MCLVFNFRIITFSKKLNGNGMSCSLVTVIVLSPLGLIITVVTLQNIITVFCRNVTLKITLFCSLIITLITRILDTFMYRLNMFLKTAL